MAGCNGLEREAFQTVAPCHALIKQKCIALVANKIGVCMQNQLFARLADDIVSTRPPANAIALWWLGQSGFAVRSAETLFYIDLFLSDHTDRLVPAPFSPADAPAADYIFCTHEHLDHLDPSSLKLLAQSSPEAQIIVPRPIVEQVLALGVGSERIVGVQPDEEISLGKLSIFPVPAMHGLTFPPFEYSFGRELSDGLCRYVGYVIEIAGVRIYHAGDSLVYDGLVEKLRELKIDIALLPINGRSYVRERQNLVGNMDEREAADLAAAVGVDMLVPMHYDMFAPNLGRPGTLVDYVRNQYPDLACYLPAYGRRFIYTKL
jgi:L-ascorbate 6-phosphate lactonase